MIENKPDVEMRDIPGYEGYAVTRDGRIWSYPKEKRSRNGGRYISKGRWLSVKKCTSNGEGPHVMLIKKGISYYIRLSRIVAKMYLSNPQENKYVCHIDRDPFNNHVDNLAWSDRACIFLDRDKKRIDQYSLDGMYIKTFSSICDAAKAMNKCYKSSIIKCAKGKIKTSAGFIWRYAD